MITPDQEHWARQFLPEGELVMRGLRGGGAPWLISVGESEAVLRVGPAEHIATEAAALRVAGAGGILVPRLIAAEGDLLLIERVRGGSAIPVARDAARLESLGRVAAAIAAVPAPGLAARARSLPEIDFAALRRESPDPLMTRAERAVESYTPEPGSGLVHGDLWQGNTLWDDGALVAVIDWDCAGVGPAGIDLGSLRLDAATAFGQDAAADVLRGWEAHSGRAPDLAYWDLVACLCTPPDIQWFGSSIREQGRPDLDDALLRARRDEFLERALATLGA